MKTHQATPFQQFINSEITKRQMSQRDFAELVGVTSSTISRLLDYNQPTEPSLEVLNKLATAINIDICVLIDLIYPSRYRINAQAQILARRIADLPPQYQEFIDSVILGASLKEQDKGSEE